METTQCPRGCFEPGFESQCSAGAQVYFRVQSVWPRVWVKTHPDVSMPARSSPRGASSKPGYSSSRLLSFLLLLPELFSPDQPYHTRPVPHWVLGLMSAGKAEPGKAHRMGEGSRLGGAGCLGTGSSCGTQGCVCGERCWPRTCFAF